METNKHLIYGRDTEECIVAIEPVDGRNMSQIYVRDGDRLTTRYEKMKYFMYVNEKDPACKLWDDQTLLIGENHYNVMLQFENLADFYNIKKEARDCYVPYLNCQYMVSSGKTLFKGMTIDDPVILYFDLEVYSEPEAHFVNAARASDEIIIIAVRTNRGFEQVLVNEGSEKKLIEDFITLFNKLDPDIVANHNIFNFDMTYLRDRAMRYNTPLAMGRDGSSPKFFDTKIKFADREKDYTNCDIYGRHVIDTMFLAEYADVVLRNMPGYGLKELTKYLGKASDDRTYIEGSDISWYWNNKRDELVKYAIDDVREAEVLYKEFAQAYFTLTQMIPMSYQQVFRYGTGNMIDYMFMREYYYSMTSFPKRSESRDFSGGYAGVAEFGVFKEDSMYADVESLYPSLGRLLKIQPKKDILGLYQDILLLLIGIRFEIKDKIKVYKAEGKDDLARKQKATDGAIKILLNTMSFGWLGWSFGAFNDYDEAERITTKGREILKLMMSITEEEGGKVLKYDTDGVLLIPPERFKGSEENETEYCKYLTEKMPEGIRIGHDGRYKGAIIFDGKSYALMEHDGKITTKGNTIRGRGVEKFGSEYIKDVISLLFNEDDEGIKQLTEQIRNKIYSKTLEAEDIVKRNNINMSLEEYLNRVSSGGTNRMAAYELAVNATKKQYTKGDVIKHYVKDVPEEPTMVRNKVVLRKPKLAAFEKAKLAEDYEYDYDPEHYLDRFDKIIKKFIILGKDKFESMFDVEVKNADIKRYTKITEKEYE